MDDEDSKMSVVVDYNKVVSAVAVAVQKAIPSGIEIPIYKEKDNDEITTPRIFVWNMDVIETEQRNIKFKVHDVLQSMQVRFHPDEKSVNKYRDCTAFASRLLHTIREIKVDDTIIRGMEIHFDIEDTILKFYVTYKYRVVYPIDDATKMRVVTVKYLVKE